MKKIFNFGTLKMVSYLSVNKCYEKCYEKYIGKIRFDESRRNRGVDHGAVPYILLRNATKAAARHRAARTGRPHHPCQQDFGGVFQAVIQHRSRQFGVGRIHSKLHQRPQRRMASQQHRIHARKLQHHLCLRIRHHGRGGVPAQGGRQRGRHLPSSDRDGNPDHFRE